MPLDPAVLPLEQVISRFAALARLSGEDLESVSFLCSDARQTILHARRTEDPVSDSDAPLLCNAAAALAFYHFALLQSALPSPDFSAADVRVSYPKPDLSAAKKLYREARALAAPLLLDQDFSFFAF